MFEIQYYYAIVCHFQWWHAAVVDFFLFKNTIHSSNEIGEVEAIRQN